MTENLAVVRPYTIISPLIRCRTCPAWSRPGPIASTGRHTAAEHQPEGIDLAAGGRHGPHVRLRSRDSRRRQRADSRGRVSAVGRLEPRPRPRARAVDRRARLAPLRRGRQQRRPLPRVHRLHDVRVHERVEPPRPSERLHAGDAAGLAEVSRSAAPPLRSRAVMCISTGSTGSRGCRRSLALLASRQRSAWPWSTWARRLSGSWGRTPLRHLGASYARPVVAACSKSCVT